MPKDLLQPIAAPLNYYLQNEEDRAETYNEYMVWQLAYKYIEILSLM